MQWQIKSYAKINLDLKIIKFENLINRHLLQSRVLQISLYDTLTIKLNKVLSITYRFQDKNITIKNDIVYKSIKAFDKMFQTKSLFNICVKKRIPVGYGLGGGSSNAASVIMFLAKFHEINNPIKLKKLMSQIGSDVLLFKDKLPKVIDGHKSSKKIQIPKKLSKELIIILPKKKNLTADIFNLYKKRKYTKFKSYKIFHNDLLEPAIEVNSELRKIISKLSDLTDLFYRFGMTGSGSAVIIFPKSNTSTTTLHKKLVEIFPSSRIEKFKIIS